ncbi:CLUMA_CG000749, isoform A [Clunio marinus]|uniref:CLUMA_CG000749, isoform A n=1 Tax=Clunio marinus TaxID=568069 RepID=A0A1J1HG04_9DIPT|nr:CLUMA_CG000749, isoform A [Clunio marinus]
MTSAALSFGFLLFVFLTEACIALPSCKAEKAINHMRKIKDVDSYIYNDTHLLNINNKGIKTLNKDVFAYYANINRNQIEFIYLMYNNINDFESGAFEDFTNVRNINFGVNLLETIKRNFFRGTKKIDFLNFQSNLIHSIEAGSFDELTQLEYVYLDDNCLTHIPDHLFHHTVRIRNIFLQQNRLIHVSSTFMRPSQKLFGLNIAENRLSDISNLFRFKGLMSLIASNNKLNPINSDGISESEMISLNINNTTISEIDFVQNFGKLRELYAANNQIRSFDVETFTRNSELAYVSLQSNPLEEVSIERVKEFFPNLSVLDISNSPMESNCHKIIDLYKDAKENSINLNINTNHLTNCLENF